MFPQSHLLLNYSGETNLVQLIKLSNGACFQLPSFFLNATQNTTKFSFILTIQILNDPLKTSGVFGDFVIKYGEVNASFLIQCVGPLFKPSLEIMKSVQVIFTKTFVYLLRIFLHYNIKYS